MEFGIEKCTMLIIKVGSDTWRTEWNYQTKKKLERSKIGLMSRVFANGPGDRGSILSRGILKNQKIVLDAALLSTQHNKVRIKGKVEQSWEWISALPNTLV